MKVGSVKALLRTVEFYNKGVWEQGFWKTLKEGQIFRLRELDGEQEIVDAGTDKEICIARSDATSEPKPMVYSVEVEPFVHIDKDHSFARRIKVFRDGKNHGNQIGQVASIDMRAGTLRRLKSEDFVMDGDNSSIPVIEEPFDYVEIGPKPGTDAYKAEQAEEFKKAHIPGYEEKKNSSGDPT